ncbi:MMPL family transporter, partial [bacterium]|nr:MMPL family transporter [bacterium]
MSRAQRDLPDELENLFVIKADDNADSIIRLAATTDVLTKEELVKRVEKDVVPNLLSIPGVADVRLNGDQQRVLRVLLDPAKMAGLRVSVSEVISTLRNARLDVPAGSYESDNQELIVRAYASVLQSERIEELYIRDTVRIRDIGVVYFGPEEADSYSMLNGRLVIGMGIVRQAGSNTIAISSAVGRRLEEINSRIKEFQVSKTTDDAIFIQGALNEVLFSLMVAIGIVLIVIAIFLGQWRATMIPGVTLPVSLIGTVAAIWLLGFSINLLTLLALVLATGLIVDDAIVVLENIQRRRSLGLKPLAAAVLGTNQVFFAVLATTVTLISVFLPIAFLPSQTGKMFREFGLILAVAVSISSLVAISMCPMLASRLPDQSRQGFLKRKLNQALAGLGHFLSAIYFFTLRGFLRFPYLSLSLAVFLAGAGVISLKQINQELLPKEDRGILLIMLTGPDGASLTYSDRQAEILESILYPYKQQGIITDIYTVVGRFDKNRCFTAAILKPWEERTISQMELEEEINKKLMKIPGAQVRIFSANSLGIRGAGSGLDLAILGNNYEDILTAAERLEAAITEKLPGMEDIRIDFDTSQPELSFRINRERVNDLDVSLEEISRTLRVMVDRYEVVDLNIADESVPIVMGSIQGTANDPGDLLNIFIPNAHGELIPLTSLVTIKEAGVAAELDRFAQRRAINVDIGLAPNMPLGDAMAQVQSIANEVIPTGMGIQFMGEAATLGESNFEVTMTFLIAILVIFLVLAAQFESMGSALIVIFTVPFGLAAAVFALILSGQSINLYSQIGLVMLVGLMTKNAILLVEFMDQLRDEGKSVPEAVMEGVRVRLRPVTMTVLSTVLGSLPLILSEGPGAEARSAIGWVVFGGLGLSSLFTLYLTPLGYYLIAPYVKPRSHAGQRLEEELYTA